MGLLNCWNWKNCGRYPGGSKADELGVCPATTDQNANGFLGGIGGGRACIYLAGTLCGGKKQGDYENKKKNCLKCDYYQALKQEFAGSMSSIKFNSYCKSSQSQKNQKQIRQWVSKKYSLEETAERAKKRYKK